MAEKRGSISQDYELALNRAKILLNAFCLGDTIKHEAARGGDYLTAAIAVSLPSRVRKLGISITGVKAVERVKIFFPHEYPIAAPHVFLRDDFPESTPHFTPALSGFPPQPCLVLEPLEEFYLTEGLTGIISQLIVWLNKAAAGTLVGYNDGWEPTPRLRLNSFISTDLSYIQQLSETPNRSFKLLQAPYNDVDSGINHSCRVLIPEEGQVEEACLQEMIDDRDLKAKTGASGCLAAAFWSLNKEGVQANVCEQYFPENIKNHQDLQSRINQVMDDNRNGIIDLLLRAKLFFEEAGFRANAGFGETVPIPVFILINRPFALTGSQSNVEVLSYIIDFKPNVSMKDITENRVEFEVHQAMILPAFNQSLLSRVDDYSGVSSAALIGAGSVGSKIAVSLCRAGWNVPVIYDKNIVLPHNYARHELRPVDQGGKSAQLANTVKKFGQNNVKHDLNVLDQINCLNDSDAGLTNGADYLINTTASEVVRDALSKIQVEKSKTRYVDGSLLLQGRAGRLVIEGYGGNPGYQDIDALFYAKAAKTGLAEKFLSAEGGLTPVEIGMGCSSLTMKMSDARLSVMTALITEQILEFHEGRISEDVVQPGELVFWETETKTGNVYKERFVIEPFQVVDLDEPGWTMRIAPSVINHIEQERLIFKTVETGGVLIGTVDERSKTVTVVDTLEAPRDSRRSFTEFILTNTDLKGKIEDYFIKSGGALYDVGTWHTHLLNQPPSAKDKSTAMELCMENRAKPFLLLVHTPNEIYGLLADPAANGNLET